MLKELSPREAWKLLEEGKARLVDIREPDEIEALRAVHAEAAPLSLAGRMNLTPLAPGTAAIFTCRSGHRMKMNEATIRPLAGDAPAYTLGGCRSSAGTASPSSARCASAQAPLRPQARCSPWPGLRLPSCPSSWLRAGLCGRHGLLWPGRGAQGHAMEQIAKEFSALPPSDSRSA